MTRTLQGRRILVVEDEFIVALAAQDMLADLGATVVGPAVTVAEGLALAREALDAAVLDINMHGVRSYAVAEALRARGVPVVFATGYAAVDDDMVAGAPVVPKPYTPADLSAALLRVLGG